MANTPFPRQWGEVDLLKPETSEVLQRILEEAQSEDEITRVTAVRRFKDTIVHSYVEKSTGSLAHVAAFVLERGFLKALTTGLEECVSGSWAVFPRAKGRRRIKGDIPVLYRPVIYLGVFVELSADARTVRYMTKHSPRILHLLKAIFLRARACTDRKFEVLKEEIMDLLISNLPDLCMASNAVCTNIGQDRRFLSAVMQHAATMDLSGGTQAYPRMQVLHCAVCVVHTLQPFIEAAPLEADLLNLAARLLYVSNDKVPIGWTIELLQKLTAGRMIAAREWPLELRASSTALRSSVLALVLCPEQLSPGDHLLMLRISACLGHTLPKVTGPSGGWDLTKLQIEIEKEALEDPIAQKRAEQLRGILSSAGGKWAVYFRHKTDASAKSVVLERSRKTGLQVMETTSARKCSAPGCEKTETTAGEFRVCAACRLAVYCCRGKTSSCSDAWIDLKRHKWSLKDRFCWPQRLTFRVMVGCPFSNLGFNSNLALRKDCFVGRSGNPSSDQMSFA